MRKGLFSIMDNKVKHLELIQGIINRMSSNSFMLKGWAVSLVAGIFAIADKDADKMYFLVAYIPVIVFWFLDAYYLGQERLYRSLYDGVRKKKETEIDFSLNPDSISKKDRTDFLSCLFSQTECGFYCPLAILCTGIIIITNCFA